MGFLGQAGCQKVMGLQKEIGGGGDWDKNFSKKIFMYLFICQRESTKASWGAAGRGSGRRRQSEKQALG